MAEEKKWYYAKGGKSQGPFSQLELCRQFEAGAFGKDDHVYCKGETQGWVKASTIAGLCDSLELEPEPEPEHHEVPLYERAAYDHGRSEQKPKKAPPKPKEEKK